MLLSIACLRGVEFGSPHQHGNTAWSRDVLYIHLTGFGYMRLEVASFSNSTII